MKQIPAEIQAALSALETLKQQDEAAPHEALAKILPGVARQLQLAGEEVTPEILIAHATQGLDHLKQLSTKQPQKRNYQDIVKPLLPEPSAQNPLNSRYQELQQSLASGGNIGKEHHDLLPYAAEHGHMDIVKSLIENGADIHAQNDRALISAINKNHADMVKFLIGNGANTYTQAYLALMWAAENGHIDIVKPIFEKGVENHIQYSALISATSHGHMEIVQYILENYYVNLHAQRDRLLAVTAQKGHLEIAKFFIEKGADIHAEKDQALRVAANNGHMEIVKLLIEKGADIHAENNEALWLSARNSHIKTVKLLFENGMDVTAINNQALITACHHGRTEIIKLLIENGADVTASNNDTVILASSSGDIETVKFLIGNGADITAKNNTALILASKYGQLEMIKLLIEHGADVTAQNNAALILASQNGYLETVKYLVENGADVTQLSEETREKLDPLDVWQKMFPAVKNVAALVDLTPHFFKQDCYEAVLPMLGQEGYTGNTAQIYSYHISGLLRSEDRVLQYLEKWGKPGKQPLHDIIHMIRLPQSGQPDLKAWGDAILQHGPKLGRHLKFADKLPRPERGEGDRGYSYVKTKEKIAEFAFSNGHLNPQLASFCLDHGWDQGDFDSALKQIKKYQEKYGANDSRKAENRIPDITLDGALFDKPDYHFYKLPDGDIRGLLLGEFTDCCQHLANNGKDCSKHGFLSENGGFYVVADKKSDQIVAQSWAWRGQQGELVLDSFEYLSGHFNKKKTHTLCTIFAAAVQAQATTDITRILIASNSDAPSLPFKKAANPARPVDHQSYKNSGPQYLIATLKP